MRVEGGVVTVLELFSGAGGATEGLLAAGLDVVRCVEWDEDADAVAKAAGHPSVRGDVRASEVYEGLPPIDAVWASPPCQDWSSAGERKAAHGDRNGWPWTFDVIDFLRACGHPLRALLCENVGGMITHRADAHPDGVDRPTADIRACPRCYFEGWILPEARSRFRYVEWRELNSADYGVPQARYRVFLACGDTPFPWPEPTHSQEALVRAKWVGSDYWTALGIAPVGSPSGVEARLLEGMRQASLFTPPSWRLAPWRTVRQALGIGLPIRHQSPSAGTVQRGPDDAAPTVGGRGTLYAEPERVDGPFNPSYHLDPKHPPATYDDVAPTLRSGGNGHSAPPVWRATPAADDEFPWDYDRATVPPTARVTGGGRNPGSPGAALERTERDLTDDVGTTVSANESGNGGMWIEGEETLDGRGALPQWHRPMGIDVPRDTIQGAGEGPRPPMISMGRRRLTVRECAALQAFPPDYPWDAARTNTAASRAVGNAVPPPVAEVLGRALSIPRRVC